MKKIRRFIILVFIISGCYGGLAPHAPTEQVPKSYLNGTLTFIGGKDAWPKDSDSVVAIRVAAFREKPVDISFTTIFAALQNGDAILQFSSLPKYQALDSFSIEVPNPPIEYKYIVAVQQFTDSLTSQKVIGVYTVTGDKKTPSPVNIDKAKSAFINIDVDFKNLPPQP